MREGWEYKKLGEVCRVERGSSPRPIKKYITENEDGVNWIKIGDVKENAKYVYSTKQKITKEGAEKSRFVDVGDFILSNSMSFGRPYIMKVPGYIHDGWFVLRLPLNIDSNYFWYLLSSPLLMDQFNLLAAGAIVKNISGDLVKKAKLPIPPLPEQKQIVEILDQAFEAIDQAKANIEKNIENANELFQSKREKMFEEARTISGQKNEVLQNVCAIKTGKLNSNAMVENGKYPFFTCSREIFSIDNYAFDTEAVLLAGNNAKGDFNVKYYKGKFNAYQRTYVITVNDNDILNYSFLKHKLEHNLQAFKKQSVGANTRFLKIGMINNLEIPLPNIETQNKLCRNIDDLEENIKKIILNYNQKLTSLEELKKSILEKAFSGELTN